MIEGSQVRARAVSIRESGSVGSWAQGGCEMSYFQVLILYTHRRWMWFSLLKSHPLFFIGVLEIAGVLLSNFLTQQSISKQFRLGFLPWTIWTKSVYMVALIGCLFNTISFFLLGGSVEFIHSYTLLIKFNSKYHNEKVLHLPGAS